MYVSDESTNPSTVTINSSETMQTKTLATIAATTQKEKYTYTTITNGTQRSAVQSSEVRWEMIHTVSVAAGGGGLILIIIIIALAVVICRRNHSGKGR